MEVVNRVNPIKRFTSAAMLLFGGVMAAQTQADTLLQTPDFCSLYPLTVSASTLQGVSAGQSFSQVKLGTGQGNYSWLTWTGANDANTIAASLVPPGNSNTYTKPNTSASVSGSSALSG